jgi:hypothetical protein
LSCHLVTTAKTEIQGEETEFKGVIDKTKHKKKEEKKRGYPHC